MRQMCGADRFARFAGVLTGSACLLALGAGVAAAAPAAGARDAAAQDGSAHHGVIQHGATHHGASALPDFGNPAGHAYVPPAGRAVDTSHPSVVIGRGTPAGCTSAAVVRAVARGGIITFDCGPKPITIVMKQTAKVVNTEHQIVLDGGGKVTLSGGHKIEILYMDTCDRRQIWTTTHCEDQQWPQLTVQNITFADGFSSVQEGNGSKPYGGGAIYADGGRFKAVNTRFINNGCYKSGPDLGGAAIRALQQWDNKPVYITSDTFQGGRCSNGGALSSISVQWDVTNSVFTDNKAIGWGENPAQGDTPGGGSGGAIYLDGVDDNVTVAGTVMTGNTAREFGGAIFDVVDPNPPQQVWGALTLKDSHLHHDVSGNTAGQYANLPGLYYEIDLQIRRTVMIDSTDS